jgi:hypothetical protein
MFSIVHSTKHEVRNARKDNRPRHEQRCTSSHSRGLRDSRRAGTGILRACSRLRSGARLSFSVSENSARPSAPARQVPHLVSRSSAGPSTAAGKLLRPKASSSTRRNSRTRLKSEASAASVAGCANLCTSKRRMLSASTLWSSSASLPATRCREAGTGMGLPMIGKLLGHSQLQTTARYAHLDHDPVTDRSRASASGGKAANPYSPRNVAKV